jgi:hypothetical protein
LFYYGINAATPSLLSSFDNWGAFIFFAGWCFIALLYVYLMVPEIAGLSVEQIDDLFKGSWFNANRRLRRKASGDNTPAQVYVGTELESEVGSAKLG